MRINLFDQEQIRQNLLPFTFTRPVADIRIGILRIAEKWEKHGFEIGFETVPFLKDKFPSAQAETSVNGALCPNDELVAAIQSLRKDEQLMAGDDLLAINGNRAKTIQFDQPYLMVRQKMGHFFTQCRSDKNRF